MGNVLLGGVSWYLKLSQQDMNEENHADARHAGGQRGHMFDMPQVFWVTAVSRTPLWDPLVRAIAFVVAWGQQRGILLPTLSRANP